MIATLAPSWHDDRPHDLRCHCWDHRDTYLFSISCASYNSFTIRTIPTLYFLAMFPIIYHNHHQGLRSQGDSHDCISLYIILYIIHIFSSHFIILSYYWLLPTISWIWFTLSSDLPESQHIGDMRLQKMHHVSNVNCSGKEETNVFWQ